MNEKKQAIIDIEALFQSKSVAIVGLPKGFKSGKLFLLALLDQGFPGAIYPVNPNADEIDGLKCYPRVSAIPGDVDLAIVLVPHHSALQVVKDCAAKGVRGVVLFTAGYKETGAEEGIALEQEMARVARAAGMRILGPNCMGLYCPKTGLALFPGMSKTPGPVAMISHSGSLTKIFSRVATNRGVAFSKMVSLGNESDLTAADFLAYLARDKDSKVISAYLENIKSGPFFLETLKEASLSKPVILWKVGLTAEGSRAAASHTGAMAGSRSIWDSVVRQGGAISATGFEDWVDLTMGCTLLPQNLGSRVAILSGPGGLAVAAAEAVGNQGLRLADLNPDTAHAIEKIIPPTGTSLKNPIDVGLTASFDLDIYTNAARLLAADPNVDVVVIIGVGLDRDTNRQYTRGLIQAFQDHNKPFMVVNVPGLEEEFAQTFCQNGIPFFQSAERAMSTYARLWKYQQWRHRIEKDNGRKNSSQHH